MIIFLELCSIKEFKENFKLRFLRDSSKLFSSILTMQSSSSTLFMKIQVPNLIGIGERSRLRFDIVPQFINRVENGTSLNEKFFDEFHESRTTF